MPPKKIFFILTIGNLTPVIDSKSFLEDGKVTMTQEQKPFFFYGVTAISPLAFCGELS